MSDTPSSASPRIILSDKCDNMLENDSNKDLAKMYEHTKIETIKCECMQKLDKYMSEIIRLNSIIQEKDEMILKMKLEICDVRSQITQKCCTGSDQVTSQVSHCASISDTISDGKDYNSYLSKLKSMF